MMRIQVFSDFDGIVTRINNAPIFGSQPLPYEAPWDYREFALVIADIVRHIAKCFDVPEDAVWEWVEKERNHHTTEIEGVALQ